MFAFDSIRISCLRRGIGKYFTVIIFFFLFIMSCAPDRFIQQFPDPIPVTPGTGIFENIYNSYIYAQAIEEIQIPLTEGMVIRDGITLRFFLSNDLEVCVDDDTTFYSSINFTYLGTIKNPDYHLLWGQFYEGNVILLVNAHTGTRVWIDNFPVPSPGGNFLAVSSCSFESNYNPNRFSIFRVFSDSLYIDCSIELEEWGPGLPFWVSDFLVEVPRIEMQWEPITIEVITDTIRIYHFEEQWYIDGTPIFMM